MATKAEEKAQKEQEWLVAATAHLHCCSLLSSKKKTFSFALLIIKITSKFSKENEINTVIENQTISAWIFTVYTCISDAGERGNNPDFTSVFSLLPGSPCGGESHCSI